MSFTIPQLKDALSGFDLQISEKNADDAVVFSRVELYSMQALEPNILYVMHNGLSDDVEEQAQLLWLRSGKKANGSALVLGASAPKVVNVLAKYADALQSCLDTMRALYYGDKDLSGFCQALSGFVGNPVVAYDSSLLPVAQSIIPKDVALRLFRSEKADEAFVLHTVPDWKREDGEDVFARAGARRISDASGSQQTAAVNVLFKGEFQGYIEIFEVNKPITEGEMDALESAAQIAAMSPYSFEQSGFLIGCLEGRAVKGDLTSSWFSALHWREDDATFVVAVCSPGSVGTDKLSMDHVVRMLRLLLPYSVSQQMGEMLVAVVNERFIRRETALSKVADFLQRLGIPVCVGASEPLRGIGYLHVGYEHAEFAARLSKRKGCGAVRFEECRFAYLEDICNLDENRALVMDARVERMRTDDDEAGTDNVETLRAYIGTGFSLSAAAEDLHVHRNTVAYRLKRLQEIYGIDLDVPIRDKDAVLLLLLSCRLASGD